MTRPTIGQKLYMADRRGEIVEREVISVGIYYFYFYYEGNPPVRVCLDSWMTGPPYMKCRVYSSKQEAIDGLEADELKEKILARVAMHRPYGLDLGPLRAIWAIIEDLS